MLKSFENREGWIWYDGEFVEWKNAKTHIIGQGFIMQVLFLKVKELIMVKFLKVKNIQKIF